MLLLFALFEEFFMNVLGFFSRWQSPGDFISLAAVHISYLSELILPPLQQQAITKADVAGCSHQLC
jgi:hypothetical protein